MGSAEELDTMDLLFVWPGQRAHTRTRTTRSVCECPRIALPIFQGQAGRGMYIL
jgi:hypothetical protein